MNSFLSIITATYNSGKTLEKTLVSVLNQNYIKVEYIIVDGDSKDNTLDIIKLYQEKFQKKNIQFKWISEKDSGVYEAWNKGLRLVSGKWVSFLGSDDIYVENALEKYAKYAKENPDADFIYSKIKIVHGNNLIRVIKRKWNWNKFKINMTIPHVGGFHNMNYFKQYGFFDESYKIAGDYEMLLRAKNKLKTVFVNDFTVIMEEGGLSSKLVSVAFKEVKRAKIKTGGLSKTNVNLHYIFNYIIYYVIKVFRKLSLK